jgi:hypothetical protein
MNTDPSRRNEIDVSMLTSADVMRFEPFSRVNFSMKIEASHPVLLHKMASNLARPL